MIAALKAVPPREAPAAAAANPVRPPLRLREAVERLLAASRSAPAATLPGAAAPEAGRRSSKIIPFPLPLHR